MSIPTLIFEIHKLQSLGIGRGLKNFQKILHLHLVWAVVIITVITGNSTTVVIRFFGYLQNMLPSNYLISGFLDKVAIFNSKVN